MKVEEEPTTLVENPLKTSESPWSIVSNQRRHFELGDDSPPELPENPTSDLAPRSEGFSFFAGYFNFLNSIVGAGIIGLPFAMNEAGIYLGMIMLVVVAWLTDYCVRMLVDVGVRVGKTDYELLCEHAWGRPGFLLVSFSMFGFAYGAMLAYLVIIGDTVPVVLEEWTGSPFLGNRVFIIVLCATGICLPLSSLREIGKLANTSAVSIASVLLIVLIIVSRAPMAAKQEEVGKRIDDADETGSFAFAHRNMFQAFGGISFAFVCQHSSFLVRNSLKEPKSWNKVTHAAITSATILCSALALMGYLMFRLCTRGNVLNNFYATDQWANTARLLLALTMFFTYPMEFFVARQCLHGMIFYEDRHMEYATISCTRHYAITISTWLSTLLIALVLPQSALGLILEYSGIHVLHSHCTHTALLILEYSGGLCASMIGFVIPAALAFHFRPPSTNPPKVERTLEERSAHSGCCSRLYRWCQKSLYVARRLPVPTILVLVGMVSLTTSMYYATQVR
jgi:sodium-coupled neutral amino acid transporter 11